METNGVSRSRMKFAAIAIGLGLLISGCTAMDNFGKGLAYNSEEQKAERGCLPGSQCFARLSPAEQTVIQNQEMMEYQRNKKLVCKTHGSETVCQEVDGRR